VKLVLCDTSFTTALNFSRVYLCTIYISKEMKHNFYIQALNIEKDLTMLEIM
jgi:hypothetical protein